MCKLYPELFKSDQQNAKVYITHFSTSQEQAYLGKCEYYIIIIYANIYTLILERK